MNRPAISYLFAIIIPILGVTTPCAVFSREIDERSKAEAARRETAQLLSDLDSDSYAVRQTAGRRLQEMVIVPELGQVLAEEFQRVLVRPKVSLEVRKRLEGWLRQLPVSAAPAAENVSLAEIDELIRQLQDDSYAARSSAVKRLQWLIGNPKMACPIMIRLKQRLDNESLPIDTRSWLEPVYARARAAWLASDPAHWNLPTVSDSQINTWLDELSLPLANPGIAGNQRIQERALRNLQEVLGRDEYVARVKAMLESRLADVGLDAAGRARLRELLDLTRPAMVAEYWNLGQLAGIQHLYVDVPSKGPGAERASHFDSINDKVAHCVSGQNLTPGYYPVSVAIPHPNGSGALFHLVNLPTPRRRMAYVYFAELDQRRRFTELSRRTFDYWLARKVPGGEKIAPLSGKELLVVNQLDSSELSRFCGKYFELAEDQRLSTEDRNELFVQPRLYRLGVASPSNLTRETPSLHGVLCEHLASRGTRETIPGLLRAIEANRFLPPGPRSPRRLEWIAALSIAQRDPWPEVDRWLAGLLDRNERLMLGLDGAPELGATAAALLLTRSGQDPAQFGLKPAGDELTSDSVLRGYLFGSQPSREQIRAWWSQRQGNSSQQGALHGA